MTIVEESSSEEVSRLCQLVSVRIKGQHPIAAVPLTNASSYKYLIKSLEIKTINARSREHLYGLMHLHLSTSPKRLPRHNAKHTVEDLECVVVVLQKN